MRLALTLLVLLLMAPLCSAMVITVNDLGDAPDAQPGDGVCLTASGTCTLRAAIMEANAHAGFDQIRFSVAGKIRPDSNLPKITDAVGIGADTAPGFRDRPVVILDGHDVVGEGFEFAPGSSGSKLTGIGVGGMRDNAVLVHTDLFFIGASWLGSVSGAGPNTTGLYLDCDSSEAMVGDASQVRNVFSGNRTDGIFACGGGHTIQLSRVGTNGDGTAVVPNFWGIHLDQARDAIIDGNIVSGNTTGIGISDSVEVTVQGNVIGVDTTGKGALPNDVGVSVARGCSGTRIGGSGRGAGNTIVASFLGIGASDVTGVTILGNFLGTDSSGIALLGPKMHIGIYVDTSSMVVIGTAAAGNVLSNAEKALWLTHATTCAVENNLVGTDVSATRRLGNDCGIEIDEGTGHQIVGNVVSNNREFGISAAHARGIGIYRNIIGRSRDKTVAMGNGVGISLDYETADTTIGDEARPNVISANGTGILLGPQAGNNNRFIANQIGENRDLGIDLFPTGPTPNDLRDPDLGPNLLQNFPVITSGATVSGRTVIKGTLNSIPNSSFTIHTYRSRAAHASGFGEGETFLGTATVTTDANGDASFEVNTALVPAGSSITATATGAWGTSEFSRAVLARAGR